LTTPCAPLEDGWGVAEAAGVLVWVGVADAPEVDDGVGVWEPLAVADAVAEADVDGEAEVDEDGEGLAFGFEPNPPVAT